MGLYGDILRAADGSIFTFDKIIEFKDLGFQKEETEVDGEKATSTEEEIDEETKTDEKKATPTEEEIDNAVSSQAAIDNIFLGRFVLLTEKLWVYVKTHDGDKYTYTKIAKLHSLNSLDEENTDEWIEIEDLKTDPYLYHADAGPEIMITEGEKQFKITNGDKRYYNNGTTLESTENKKLPLNFTYYDKKGHAYKSENIQERDKVYYNSEKDFTLILNGGGFLGKYLTPEENNN